MRLWPVLMALLLPGCGAIATHEARDPYGVLIGMGLPDLLSCAGVPDKVQRTGPDTAVAQWSVSTDTPDLRASVLVFGSIELGGANACRFVATVLRDGTVADVAFPQAHSSLVAGPFGACGQLVGECLAHPSRTGLSRGYDAFAYLFQGRAS